jgi:hypothetical protein
VRQLVNYDEPLRNLVARNPGGQIAQYVFDLYRGIGQFNETDHTLPEDRVPQTDYHCLTHAMVNTKRMINFGRGDVRPIANALAPVP